MTQNALADAPTAVPSPPTARKQPRVDVVHGERREDDYFWMREKSNPEVASYLEAENAYADAVMKPTEAFQQTLYGEMLGRIQETDVNVPYRQGAYFYYSRTEQGKQYPILCRKFESLEAPEQVTLDVNLLAEGHSFMALGAYAVSDDGNLLAYSTDSTGFRQYDLFIKDLRTGQSGPAVAPKTGSVAWAADNRTLFYTIEDEAKRHYRLYRHRLGAATPDELVFEEPDEAFNIGVGRTRSRDYLVLGAGSLTTAEARVLRADDPTGEWRLMAPRIHDQEYDVDHHGGIEPGFDAHHHRFRRRHHRGRRQEIVGELHGLRRAGFLADEEHLADHVERGFCNFAIGARAGDHDGQRSLLGAADAAADGAVDLHDILCSQQAVNLRRHLRADG